MKSTNVTARTARRVRNVLGCCLLFGVALSATHSQDPVKGIPPSSHQPIKLPVEPGAVEIAFTDGSNLKMLLRDEKITLVTPHGKLLIAATEFQRIEFATRVSDEDAERIRAAIADLGSAEFRKRESASAALLKLREKGYPALLRAVEQKDLEVVRRAKELIQQISAAVPAERLMVREKDVVYTADSKIAGRIAEVSLKAHTAQFGLLQVKLSDIRSLGSQAIEPSPRPQRTYNFGSSSTPPIKHKKQTEEAKTKPK